MQTSGLWCSTVRAQLSPLTSVGLHVQSSSSSSNRCVNYAQPRWHWSPALPLWQTIPETKHLHGCGNLTLENENRNAFDLRRKHSNTSSFFFFFFGIYSSRTNLCVISAVRDITSNCSFAIKPSFMCIVYYQTYYFYHLTDNEDFKNSFPAYYNRVA